MTPTDLVALFIASAALGLSFWNFWNAEYRQGKLLLSRPTIFFFGWDRHDMDDKPKIMFRSALFSTASKGLIVENLYLKVRLGSSEWVFPFWGYDDGSGMVRGSGIHIGREGQIAYHHFNPIAELDDFSFESGEYHIDVVASIFGSRQDTVLGTYKFVLEKGYETNRLMAHEVGTLWTWLPNESVYSAESSPRTSDGKYSASEQIV